MADVEVPPRSEIVEENGSQEEIKEQEQTVDPLNQKILKQIEFYFGDANLPNDKFIKAESAKNEGWFPLSALLTFNRIQNLLSGLPKEEHAAKIVEALRPSVLVDVDGESANIRRNLDVPLPEGNSIDRCIFVKGFHRTDTRLDDLIEHFNSKYSGVDAVIMRWYKEKILIEGEKPTNEKGETNENGKKKPLAEMATIAWVKKFKGSIFIIFKTVEQAEAFLKDENNTYGGATLIKMKQKDHRQQKKLEFEQRQAARGKAIGDTGKTSESDPKVEEEINEIPKGTLLKIKDIPADGISRELLKAQIYTLAKEEDFPIAYIDFQRGDVNGFLRFDKAGAAAEVLKLIPDGKLPLKDDSFATLELTDDAEEKAYMIRLRDSRLQNKRKGGFGGRGGGRGRGRGGRGHGGKRGRR